MTCIFWIYKTIYIHVLKFSTEKLGTPSREFIGRIHSLPDRTYVENRPRHERHSFDILFSANQLPIDSIENPQLCSAEARDLLSKMLKIDSRERCSVNQALQHDYINIRRDDQEINAVILYEPFVSFFTSHHNIFCFVYLKPIPARYDRAVEDNVRNIEQWRELVDNTISEFRQRLGGIPGNGM